MAFVGSVTTLNLLALHHLLAYWANISWVKHGTIALHSEHVHVMDGWIIYQALDPFFARPFACGWSGCRAKKGLA